LNPLANRPNDADNRDIVKYERFEDLPVWKAAMELAVTAYALTEHQALRATGDLRDQLRRAALSVSNNIAEGFERGSTAELLMFLYIARGSAGEVRSMMHFCERRVQARQANSHDSEHRPETSNRESQIRNATNAQSNTDPHTPNSTPQVSNPESQISNLRFQISSVRSLAESCSRQIRGWADSLQNSDIPGQRHLNDSTRKAYDHKRRSTAFMNQIEETVRQQVEAWSRANAQSREKSQSADDSPS
jgi:four helix bundle protein